jgi:diguanylate cyclase (GGDEF)-like protein
MSRSFLLWAAGVVGPAFVAFAIWLAAGWGGPATVLAVSDIGLLLAGAFATACAAWTARSSRGRQRQAWSVLTVALACFLFGDVLWAFYELVLGWESAPFPSPADIGYLLFPVAACLALILLPIGSTGQSEFRLVIDGVMVAGSLFAIFWAIGLDDLFRAGDRSWLAFAVSAAYPLTDVVLLTVALLVLTRARKGQRACVSVFTLAIASMAVSDGAYLFLNAEDAYVSGNPIDIGWVAGLLLLGGAAMIGSRSTYAELGLAQAPSRTSLWLPYLPVPFAAVCIALSPTTAPVVVAALLLVSAVLARQFIIADENRRLLVEVSEHAFRDPLTGLANRALLQDRLAHAVALQHRDDRDIAVLVLDLDDFKLVNDSLGHPTGDALLRAVGERIVSCVRAGDTVARVGGDEFAILIEDGPELPLIVAHRIFDAFDDPFVIDDHDLFMRPSMGVSATTTTTGGDVRGSAEILLKQADLAMYAAKRSQHGGVHAFTPDMQLIDVREIDPPRDRNASGRRNGSAGLQLFAQLRRAIDKGELSLVYQPKFTIASGRIAGVEALVRWEHPQRGLLQPRDFLPLARQNGLMGAVTEAVLDRAVRDATQWSAQGADIPFAVNLFPPSLEDLELPDRIMWVLATRGLTAECLTVEITEDFLLGNTRRTLQVLETLRGLGIRVAIDDFGSGYSALSYLRELPIDELKLDRHFVAPILEDDRAEAIVRAVIDLTHELGIVCVAEGVENAATAARLADLGCDTIQGNYCCPPVSAAEVLGIRPLPPAGAVATMFSGAKAFEER